MSIQPFIKCSQIKASLTFYTEILDFSVVQEPDPDPNAFLSVYAFLERDGSFIHLSEHSGDGVFGNVIYVRVENIDKIYEQFILNGLEAQAFEMSELSEDIWSPTKELMAREMFPSLLPIYWKLILMEVGMFISKEILFFLWKCQPGFSIELTLEG